MYEKGSLVTDKLTKETYLIIESRQCEFHLNCSRSKLRLRSFTYVFNPSPPDCSAYVLKLMKIEKSNQPGEIFDTYSNSCCYSFVPKEIDDEI